MALNYFRAVSSGPATPLVLSVTTFHQQVQISLTHLPAVFDAPALKQVKQSLQTLIHDLTRQP